MSKKLRSKKIAQRKYLFLILSFLIAGFIGAQLWLSYVRGNLGQENGLYYALLHLTIFVVFLLGIFFVIYSYLREKERLELEKKIYNLHENLADTENQLIRAGKLATIGELAAGVAHEVMNPLASISSYCQLIQRKREELSPAQLLEYADKISGEIFRVSRIVREIKDYARPNAEDLISKLTHPDDAVSETLDLLHIDPRFKNIEVVIDLLQKNVQCQISKEKFKQVLLNLFINAADAMPNGGTLTVASALTYVGSSSRYYTLSIQDTGTGIDESLAQKIYEPFFTTKPHGKGTGLGLAVSRRIIDGFKGKLYFKSEKNLGTVFYIDLPLSSSPAQVHEIITSKNK